MCFNEKLAGVLVKNTTLVRLVALIYGSLNLSACQLYSATTPATPKKTAKAAIIKAKPDYVKGEKIVKQDFKFLGEKLDTKKDLKTEKQKHDSTKIHIVQHGETLYGIARLYGCSVSNLAKLNHLGADYKIRPYQKLKLLNDANVAKIANFEQNLEAKIEPKPLKPQTQTLTTPRKAPAKQASNASSWLWPVEGQVIDNFGERKGLHIKNAKGSKIKAAQNGEVVYSGNALKGYGNLIIIKHADNYLSAYAHNDSLLVGEGTKVTQGQVIATMGNTSSAYDCLHFEIRKNGKPINPLSILPKTNQKFS